MKPQTKYALIASSLLILWTLIGYLMGNENIENLKWAGNIVTYGVIIVCFVFVVKELRQQGNGFISFGKAFGAQMRTGLILSVIYTAFAFFYFKFMNPAFVDYLKDKQIEEMANKGMEEEKAAQILSFWMSPGMMVVWMLVGLLVMSVIFALAIAAIMRKENPDGPFAATTNDMPGGN